VNRIEYEERKRVYTHAIDRYGIKPQMLMVIEEMSELTKAICKFFRCPSYVEPDEGLIDAIAEETADVTIMLEQLRLILGINDNVCEHMDEKIVRLADRLGLPKTE
jgi:NTP pyrophosphatase (non-canonical NTP hydrolase)